MSEFSPTPGPWKVEAPGLADEGTRAILSPSGDCLARLSAGGNGPHLASNAALIAAAPDLLESIKAVIDFCFNDKPPANADAIFNMAVEKWDRVHKAIAKAEGRA